eukprot:NODE_27448_length_513_cov_2.919689.p2 GENE.NODE_27448_length_513_cov_2.919689~~NODE_27448_length_513_cov_2.919689.p2  ORF type:complete len:107 (-),score=28.01 NODE_27448_length_513_cov_2.919689:55-375(-)
MVTVEESRSTEVFSRALSIDIKGLTVNLSGRMLLDNTHLRLLPGRYGFIGANGAGKTTLLRLMSEKCIPSYPNLQTLSVEQEDVDTMPTEKLKAFMKKIAPRRHGA